MTAASQTVLKFLPPGITPPYVLLFNASSVPVLQLAISSKTLSQSRLFDYAQNFIRPQLATVAGAAIPSPYGGKVRQVQVDIDQQKLQSYGLSAQDVVNALAAQNLIIPMGTQKIGRFEYVVSMNNAPDSIEELNRLPVKSVHNSIVYMSDVAFVYDGAPPQINVVRVDGAHAVLMTIQKAGTASTLDVINGVKALLPKIRASLPPGLEDQGRRRSIRLRAILRQCGAARRRHRRGADGPHDPAVSRQLALDAVIILVSIPLAILGGHRGALGDRRDDQRD